MIPAKLDSISSTDAYLLDNGEYINLFVGA